MVLADVLKLIERRQVKRRNLSPHELALRRASHPFGMAAVLAGAVMLWPEISALVLPLLMHPADNPAPVVLLVAGMGLAVAMAAKGIGAAAGLRDWVLAVRALIKLGVGAFAVWKLWQFAPWAAYGRDWWLCDLLRMALLIGVFCAVTGLVRLLLLVIGGGGAIKEILKLLRRRGRPMKPARRRS
jgi:hypothetical protein